VTGCATQENIVFTDGELVEIMQEDERLELSYTPESSNNLSLENAMALAVKYNLEHRVKMMEEAVSAQNFELAKKDQLPVFAANAGYLDRSNEDASRSISVLTRKESLEPSTSQEPERTNADLSLRWNLLDFGVSLLQMKQDANNLEVTTKAREKVMTNLLQQVRRSYWKAVAMEQLRPELADILRRVNRALDNLYAVREESLRT
ncbi:MAG: TolC family protein, partial [Gammaproteobacteria bacterium]